MNATKIINEAMNKYGDIDIRSGVPEGLVHLPAPQASRTCTRIGIPYARAMIGFTKWRGMYSPQFSGVVVAGDDAEKIAESRAAKTAKTGTRTATQLAKIEAMRLDDLFALSVQAMHALNRRAKAYPSQADDIYQLKDAFLAAVVAAGRGTVGRFEIERVTGYCHSCDECGREWYARDELSTCHRCWEDSQGSESKQKRVWYLIRVGGCGFHQPGPKACYDALATPIEPHDPTNRNTDIPKIGLVIEAQKRCVELATVRLRALLVAGCEPEARSCANDVRPHAPSLAAAGVIMAVAS